jgi:hypothetical protein
MFRCKNAAAAAYATADLARDNHRSTLTFVTGEFRLSSASSTVALPLSAGCLIHSAF